MTTEQMRERATARNELRGMLAAYRYDRDLMSYPSLITQRRTTEAPEVKYKIFCGKDEDISADIATELINTSGFKRFIRRYDASYDYVYAKGRTTLEITIP